MKKIRNVGIVILILGLFWLSCIHYTEAYLLGVRWNLVTGELQKDEAAGFHITPPWVLVSRIDIRPMRVCVTTTGRGFNCLLIQFVPEHWHEFAMTEGFRYWWWANRISFNLGYDTEYRGLKDIFRGYAYGVKKYPFIKVLKEYKEGE